MGLWPQNESSQLKVPVLGLTPTLNSGSGSQMLGAVGLEAEARQALPPRPPSMASLQISCIFAKTSSLQITPSHPIPSQLP